jgi:hypothetical protein
MKKTTNLIIVATAIAAAFGASSAAAQRNYDPKTVETIQGKVLSMEKTTPAKNRGYGVHLVLQTDKETIPVHLGPASYIDKQTFPQVHAASLRVFVNLPDSCAGRTTGSDIHSPVTGWPRFMTRPAWRLS